MWDVDEIRFFRLGGKVPLGTETFLLSLVFFFFFLNSVLLCHPEWPKALYLNQTGLELRMSFLPQPAR